MEGKPERIPAATLLPLRRARDVGASFPTDDGRAAVTVCEALRGVRPMPKHGSLPAALASSFSLRQDLSPCAQAFEQLILLTADRS